MIDTHCHLNFPDFDKDLNKVIKRAEEKDVTKIINTGTNIESSKKAVELSRRFENLYAIIGIHPHEAVGFDVSWINELELLGKNEKVIGIGEIGLDYFYEPVDKQRQKVLFIKQIELSIKLKLPLQIHSRLAAIDIIEILKSFRNELLEIPGVFHCMSGDLDYLKNVLNLGFYVGFDGNITYKGLAPKENTLLTELVSYTPIDRIVCETDAPYLTPVPYRGGKNEPGYVIIVGEFIAKIKNAPFEEINRITTLNANKIFKI
jgi:TatD DNase family protein